MNLVVNEKAFSLENGSNLLELLACRGLDPAVVVIEVNRAIVRKEAFGSCLLREGDRVEILRFVGGG